MTLHHGDCRAVMAGMEPESVDAIVTDPPYGLSFMGKGWDHGLPGIPFWTEALRVLKPGAHLVAFGGTRTFHRLTCALEDAGFEIRDCLSWLYGSGFPKSHNLGNGWGTALKPGWEPIVLARKPLGGTVAANVARHGTGALNIDGCRILSGEQPEPTTAPGWDSINAKNAENGYRDSAYEQGDARYEPSTLGRWPANVVLDEAAAALLDATVGERGPSQAGTVRKTALGVMNDDGWQPKDTIRSGFGDSGGPSRFFYTAKASRRERNRGLEGMPERAAGLHDDDGYREPGERKANHTSPLPTANHHPTVKPVALMRWLVRLVTPPGGLVLDPFLGSGSTGIAAALEGFAFVGIEQDAEYVEIARRRIAHVTEPLLTMSP